MAGLRPSCEAKTSTKTTQKVEHMYTITKRIEMRAGRAFKIPQKIFLRAGRAFKIPQKIFLRASSSLQTEAKTDDSGTLLPFTALLTHMKGGGFKYLSRHVCFSYFRVIPGRRRCQLSSAAH